MLTVRRKRRSPRKPTCEHADLHQCVADLADDLDAAAITGSRPSGKPVPFWFSDLAAELRGLLNGAQL